MSYTLAQSVTKTRELLNEDTASFFSDTEIQGWIQEGSIFVSSKLLSAITYDTITLVQDQYTYTASDHSWIGDCLKPKYALYIDSTGPQSLQHVDPDKFGHIDRVDSEPSYYHYDSFRRAFYILPTPDSTVDSEVVGVVYSYETNDVTNLKDEHQPLVWLYATSRGKMKERLYQEAGALMNQFMLEINFEKNDKYNIGEEKYDDFMVK
jgi:hypothetical protein